MSRLVGGIRRSHRLDDDGELLESCSVLRTDRPMVLAPRIRPLQSAGHRNRDRNGIAAEAVDHLHKPAGANGRPAGRYVELEELPVMGSRVKAFSTKAGQALVRLLQ